MRNLGPLLSALEVISAVLLMVGILLQTPRATGLGGTIGGGDGGFRGGYRTRRGLERHLFWFTWLMVVVFLLVSLANIVVAAHGG